MIMDYQNEDTHELAREKWLKDIAYTYGDQITKLAYSYLKDWNQAQDVAQDVLLTCFKNYENRSHISSYKAWIYRVTVNRSKDILKSSFLKKVILNNSLVKLIHAVDHSPEAAALRNEKNNQLIEAVFALPIKYREVVLLYYYEELDTKEITDIIGINENTVRTRLRRARDRLGDLLKGVSMNE